MAFPLNTASVLNSLGPGAVSATELYSRVSKSLLVQNASIQKLDASLARDQTRLSGLGQLHSALANFQALNQSLAGVGLQTSANASNPAVLSALTTGSAKAGSYAVEVRQLAQAQVLATRAQRSQDGAIGDGAPSTIRIDTGTESGNSFSASGGVKTITIDSANNSLKGIAAAFKEAGIDARIVRGTGGYTLQLNAQSGSANSLKISVSGDSALQQLLGYNPSGARALSQVKSAQDALLSIDGKQIVSASNVITGELEGTALALSAKGLTTVTVGQDNAAIERNVGNLVSGFNNVSAKLKSLRQAELRTDPALAQAQDQLSQLIARNGSALAKVGVTLDRNGELKIDSKVLKDAVTADATGVAALFTGQGKGVADQFDAKLGQLIGSNGAISKQKVSLERGVSALSGQRTRLTDALKAQASLVVSQYTQISQQGETNTALPGLPGGGASSLITFLG